MAGRVRPALVCRYAPPGGPNRALLEIGCGLGDLLSLLQSRFVCTGVGLIQDAAGRARQCAPRARVVVGDGASWLATATTPLDVVVALHVMEHLPDPARTIRDAFVALVPGGLLLFATPHPDYALRRLKDREHDAIGKDPTHINCHVPSVWAAWCEEAGFTSSATSATGCGTSPFCPSFPSAYSSRFSAARP